MWESQLVSNHIVILEQGSLLTRTGRWLRSAGQKLQDASARAERDSREKREAKRWLHEEIHSLRNEVRRKRIANPSILWILNSFLSLMQISELKRTLAETEERATEAESARAEEEKYRASETSRLQTSLEEYRSRAEDLESKYRQTSDELYTLKSQYEDLKLDYENVNNRLESLRSERDSIEQKLVELRSDLTEAKKKRDEALYEARSTEQVGSPLKAFSILLPNPCFRFFIFAAIL